MKVRELIAKLQEHDPNCEVHGIIEGDPRVKSHEILDVSLPVETPVPHKKMAFLLLKEAEPK
jgi:hypothetical protein